MNKSCKFVIEHGKDGRIIRAATCGICGSPGDKLASGAYECQDNPLHVADGTVGIWSDFSENFRK